LLGLAAQLGNGYAAGCEAGLRPAGVVEQNNWAMPLVRA
jgi:hypothetical protein